MKYCKKCGAELEGNEKFCPECGEKIEDSVSRQTNYEGKIHKCPNCGEILNSFTAVCPSCGFELRDSKSSNGVTEFAKKLQNIESKREKKKISSKEIFGKMYEQVDTVDTTDEQKISLIRNTPIPNTKEDLYEFLILSRSNIEVELYSGTSDDSKKMKLELSNAWKAKFEQAYQKAKWLFKDDERMQQIQELYDEMNKEIRKAKYKYVKITAIVVAVWIVLHICLVISGSLSSSSSKNDSSSVEENSSNTSEVTSERTNSESQNKLSTSESFSDNIIANSNDYIKIKKAECVLNDGELNCIVTVTNLNSKKAIYYPTYRVTVYDKKDKVLGSQEISLNLLYPNQDVVNQESFLEVSEMPNKIDVTALEPDESNIVDINKLEHHIYKDMQCKNITAKNDSVTGELYNSNDYKVDNAMIVVVVRNSKKKIVSSANSFVSDVPADGKVPFDISLFPDVTSTDKVEVYAYMW